LNSCSAIGVNERSGTWTRGGWTATGTRSIVALVWSDHTNTFVNGSVYIYYVRDVAAPVEVTPV
jgi:hypothetical protein